MDYREEVRLAIALNGGVSLAVWMGGCAVELDAARRAHLGPDVLDEHRERRVYAGIAEALGRRLVVDVMAGSSAGGINAALLAAATIGGVRLHPDFIREQWIGLGDIAALLHDPGHADPHSLLRGEQFHSSLVSVFDSILGDKEKVDPRNRLASPQADNPDAESEGRDVVPKVDITATDLAGDAQSFKDVWGSELSASEYRARFRFRSRADYRVERLANAARSSASFPGAFEPWAPHPDSLGLAGLKARRWMIDGGLLDNAPIRAALDLIPSQPARLPVRRLLCYLNPDPALDQPEDFWTGSGRVEESPTIDLVLGRSLKILRAAAFVDHLRAIQRAVQPRSTFEERDLPLLKMPLPTLAQMAAALAPSYVAERARLSIEELTGSTPNPGELEALLAAPGSPLPWLPAAGQETDGEWRLGIRAAQRTLHMMVDLLRRGPGAPDAGAGVAPEPGPPPPAEQAAAEIDRIVAQLEGTHERVGKEPSIAEEIRVGLETGTLHDAGRQNRLRASYAPFETEARNALHRGAELLREALSADTDPRRRGLSSSLFGESATDAPGGLGELWFERFLRRMSAIEIVKRAFGSEATIETSEPLGFAQLTPYTRCTILDPKAGEGGEGPNSPEAKLTGIRVGHFAAFYRRSWRVNDYMWGRLDAANRVVDMMFDGVEDLGEFDPGPIVAAILPADAGRDLRWAIHEGLGGTGEPPEQPALAALLAETIAAEIASPPPTGPGSPPPLAQTRDLCARALQFEILADELPRLLAEADTDARAGAGTRVPPIEGEGPAAQIASLRGLEPLPVLLGRDSLAEATSDLALRTGSKAAFVGLSAMRAVHGPLARVLGVVRPALYGLAGVLSPSRFTQLAVVIGFFAATAFLAARGLVIDASAEIEASDIIAKWNLVAYLSVLFVLGLASPPLIRTLARVQRIPNFLLSAAIVLSTGVLAALPDPGFLERICGDLGLRWLMAPTEGADPGLLLPEALMWAIILVTAGLVAGAWPAGKRLKRLKAPLTGLFERPWAGALSMVALLGVSIASLVYTLPELWSGFTDPEESWERWVSVAPPAGTLLVGGLLLLTAGPGRSRREPAETSITLGGVEFTSVAYSEANDLLRLRTRAAGDDDELLWMSDENDRLSGTLAKGVTTIEIGQAAARLAAGEPFMTFERPFRLSVDAADVARAIEIAERRSLRS